MQMNNYEIVLHLTQMPYLHNYNYLFCVDVYNVYRFDFIEIGETQWKKMIFILVY